MILWNDHHELEGKHAFLGASQHRWLGYDDATLIARYSSQFAPAIGTALHDLAKECINARIKLNRGDKHIIDMAMYRAYIPKKVYDANAIINLLAAYVNDAIGFRMSPEVVLYYSKNCFGTTDAIAYNEYEHVLRIHDFKSGSTPASFDQLVVYAALFYLEYKLKPSNHTTILRIYQRVLDENGDEQECPYTEIIAKPEDIEIVMDRIKSADSVIQDFKGVK